MSVISIIIPVFNQWEYTNACLEALLKHDTSEIPLEIVIVDNASTDYTSQGLIEWQQRWNSVKVQTMDVNTGFSLACNYGASISSAPYLLFLNNDTIPQAGWLRPLLNELKNPEVGIVAPKLLYPDGLKINHAGYVFGRGNFYAIYHGHKSSLPAVNIKRDYQALLGACILLKRDLFFELGQFAEYGLEDIDLCLKAGEKGLKCRYVPESVVYHHGSVTLKLSESGTFPVNDSKGFGQRWSSHYLIWDDYLCYINDGMWPAPPGSSPIDTANNSMAAVIESGKKLQNKQVEEAMALLDQAVAFWPQNPVAFTQKIKIIAETGQTDLMIKELQRLPEFDFEPLLLQEILPILSRSLPPDIWKAIKDKLGSAGF